MELNRHRCSLIMVVVLLTETIMKNYQTLTAYSSMTMTIMAEVVDKIYIIESPPTETMQTIVIQGKVPTWKFSLHVVLRFLFSSFSPLCAHWFSHCRFISFSHSRFHSHWCQISRTLAQRAFHKTPFRKSVFILCEPHFPIDVNEKEKGKNIQHPI